MRLSSLASLSKELSSLLASELLSWTTVRSPSSWFRASVVSLICALQNMNIHPFSDEGSAALKFISLDKPSGLVKLVPELLHQLHEHSDSRGGGVARVDDALGLC